MAGMSSELGESHRNSSCLHGCSKSILVQLRLSFKVKVFEVLCQLERICIVTPSPAPAFLPAMPVHALVVMKLAEYDKITSLRAPSTPGSGSLELNADMPWLGPGTRHHARETW